MFRNLFHFCFYYDCRCLLHIYLCFMIMNGGRRSKQKRYKHRTTPIYKTATKNVNEMTNVNVSERARARL